MNDTELDRLLDTWEAPSPPKSLRGGLEERFPRAQRRKFARPWRWALVILLASVALAVAMAQTSQNRWDIPVVSFLNQLYEKFLQGQEARQSARIAREIRDSEPRVYVDGQLVAPLEYAPPVNLNVQVPGEGMYAINSYRYLRQQTADGRPTGWIEAGHIHGNVIEFRAGDKQVRIECNKPIVDGDRPVFAMRR